ncbi:hypothetical protein BACCELL_04261 [Bacteroides cellulosilyticus DSM 14838]|uniref:Uncharacterized protein n=1 Tax=Bacteroides cellulosilyticus DSM 14838 TaxID=537012 RepID=E2NIX5_9BACE|nr:hypothetical protein BACCELL_04261 [Bacteroides cellulosilyticus DSM 14838]
MGKFVLVGDRYGSSSYGNLFPPFPLHLKARALLRPLHWLHLPVPIDVRT